MTKPQNDREYIDLLKKEAAEWRRYAKSMEEVVKAARMIRQSYEEDKLTPCGLSAEHSVKTLIGAIDKYDKRKKP